MKKPKNQWVNAVIENLTRLPELNEKDRINYAMECETITCKFHGISKSEAYIILKRKFIYTEANDIIDMIDMIYGETDKYDAKFPQYADLTKSGRKGKRDEATFKMVVKVI